MNQIIDRAVGLEGITISGGEPLQQAPAVLQLLKEIRRNTGLSIILFSGYTRSEIEQMPYGPAILSCLDVLIDGPYEQDKRLADNLRGSENQKIHLLSKRYRAGDFDLLPNIEIIIDDQGDVVVTGFDSLS